MWHYWGLLNKRKWVLKENVQSNSPPISGRCPEVWALVGWTWFQWGLKRRGSGAAWSSVPVEPVDRPLQMPDRGSVWSHKSSSAVKGGKDAGQVQFSVLGSSWLRNQHWHVASDEESESANALWAWQMRSSLCSLSDEEFDGRGTFNTVPPN